MNTVPDYQKMIYKRCGNSGIQLPIISLGLWHNFGDYDNFDNATQMILYAFEQGITHFDIANNYGPEPGAAETNFGKIFRTHLAAHRNELIIASKAGHWMWEGPYGYNSSRKNLMASCDDSLRRTGLDYFDIFYSHRYDGVTPIEETMQALVDLVRQGKVLYVGISKYPPREQQIAYDYLREAHVPCLASQYRYSMFVREPEEQAIEIAARNGSGVLAFQPLAQGQLTNRYLNGIPADSRAAKPTGYLKSEEITPQKIEIAKQLNVLAQQRGQTLAQMCLAWALRDERVTSLVLGCSSVKQLTDNIETINNLHFTLEELNAIEHILAPFKP